MQLIRSILRGRDDEGSIVMVAILVVGLAIVSTMTVTTVLNGNNATSTATQGEQAVAQANAGVSDALFRLDQMGQSVSSFCEGAPPAGATLPAGTLTTGCSPSTSPPLPSAPGLLFESVNAQSNQQGHIVSVATVGGQTRVISTDVYQIVDDFGIYGLADVTFKGNPGGTIDEVDAQGHVVTNTQTFVDVGIGPDGTLSCNGGGFSSGVAVIEGSPNPGAASCAQVKGLLKITPNDPQVCSAGESTVQGFSPCVAAAGGFALDASGNPYCPLPNVTGLAPGVDPAADAPAAPPDGPATVYDCDTAGGAISVSSTGAAQPIQEGSYYITSNNASIGDISSDALAGGPVSLYVLPSSCYANGNPITGGSSYASTGCAAFMPTSGGTQSSNANCAASPAAPAQSLSLLDSGNSGSQVNLGGNPGNLSLYWAGCGAVSIGVGSHTAKFTGYIYTPGGGYTADSHFAVTGSIVLGSLRGNGAPTIHFEYAEHQSKVLQAWTELNYQISP